MDIQIKRVYDPIETSDGYRILVDKFWPRGVKKNDLSYDEWNKNLAPPDELRKYFHEDKSDNWNTFYRKYEDWLMINPLVIDFIKKCHSKNINKITLLYSAHDTKMNHALILQHALKKLDMEYR